MLVVYALIPIAAYLLGSVPFGLILCKLVRGVDIREHGSRNIGAANAGRVCGWPFFAGTFLLDFAKGLAAVPLGVRAACWWLGWLDAPPPQAETPELLGVLYGLCAILGHTFPLYLRFRGGKAVATGFGVFVALAPLAAVIAFGVWLVLFAAFRYASLASMAAAVASPVALAVLERDAFGVRLPVFILAVVVAAFVIIRHRANIRRLLAGTENRFGRRK